jgi:hypothetical protein
MAHWLEAAASVEPDLREAARINLFGLTPDDLPVLHDVAKALIPLKPSQADVLRQAIVHIRTRAIMMEEPSSGRAVLGVMLWQFDLVGFQGEPLEKPFVGVEVISRLQGFVAARYLRDADWINGIEVDGTLNWFESRQQLQQFVSQLPVGKVVTVLVRRGGQDLRLTFPLDAGRASDGVVPGDPPRTVLQIKADAAEEAAAKQMEQEFADVLNSGMD